MTASRTGWRAFLFGIGVTVIVAFFRLFGWGGGMANWGLDTLFWLRGPVEPETPIVIVAIDNESFSEMPERWVWPRNFHARLIEQIMKGGPKAIAFDVIFSEETAKNPAEDVQFAAACRRAGNVIMGSQLVRVRGEHYESETLQLPFPRLRKSVFSTGLVNTPKDADAFVRRARPIWWVQDARHYALSFEVLRRYLDVGKGEINYEPGRLEFGDRIIPLDENNQALVNYCGPAKTFKTIPYYQVYKGITDPAVFKDAIVLVGATAEVLHDTFPAPFTRAPVADESLSSTIPGVEIHANVIEMVVQNRYITSRSGLSFFLQVSLGVLISLAAIRLPVWLSALSFAGCLAGIFGYSVHLFTAKAQYLEFVYPSGSVFLAFLGSTLYRASVEMREKNRVRGTFARYVSPHVLTTVLSHPPELGGHRRVASILFSDVRGFTSMSEKLSAHEVVEILNEYLTQMVDVVLLHDGTLDKFVGDAVMAVFGSPMDQPDHALRAVSAAWHMSERHNELKNKWIAEGKVPFEIGIGVNTGEIVAGNMGSPQRMEFTVIGDNVNLAARLESATKELQAKILISGATYDLVKDHVQVKQHEPIKVKGKEQPIEVYELLGIDEEVAMKTTKPKNRGN